MALDRLRNCVFFHELLCPIIENVHNCRAIWVSRERFLAVRFWFLPQCIFPDLLSSAVLLHCQRPPISPIWEKRERRCEMERDERDSLCSPWNMPEWIMPLSSPRPFSTLFILHTISLVWYARDHAKRGESSFCCEAPFPRHSKRRPIQICAFPSSFLCFLSDRRNSRTHKNGSPACFQAPLIQESNLSLSVSHAVSSCLTGERQWKRERVGRAPHELFGGSERDLDRNFEGVWRSLLLLRDSLLSYAMPTHGSQKIEMDFFLVQTNSFCRSEFSMIIIPRSSIAAYCSLLSVRFSDFTRTFRTILFRISVFLLQLCSLDTVKTR